jgi:hypothetical protein
MNSNFGKPPLFGGQPGELVPEVDPEDLKALWRAQQEFQSRYPGKKVAMGMSIVEQICKPGADIQAIAYRASMMWLLSQIARERFSPFMKDGQPIDTAFRAAAKVPVKWMGVASAQQAPFDVDEFLHLCSLRE